jgi:hypothetical protein
VSFLTAVAALRVRRATCGGDGIASGGRLALAERRGVVGRVFGFRAGAFLRAM